MNILFYQQFLISFGFIFVGDRICDNSNSICHNCPADKTDRCENFGNSYICHCMTGYNGTHCEVGCSIFDVGLICK